MLILILPILTDNKTLLGFSNAAFVHHHILILETCSFIFIIASNMLGCLSSYEKEDSHTLTYVWLYFAVHFSSKWSLALEPLGAGAGSHIVSPLFLIRNGLMCYSIVNVPPLCTFRLREGRERGKPFHQITCKVTGRTFCWSHLKHTNQIFYFQWGYLVTVWGFLLVPLDRRHCPVVNHNAHNI